jgi:hypothetical protein
VNLAAEDLPARVRLDQEGPELLAEPEVAASVEPDRLDVEVSARQQALGANRGIDGDGVVPPSPEVIAAKAVPVTMLRTV